MFKNKSISILVCIAVMAGIVITPAIAMNTSTLANESQTSPIMWCSDETAFNELFEASALSEADTPQANYDYTVTETSAGDVEIDFDANIVSGFSEITFHTTGEGTLTPIMNGKTMLDGKLRGTFETGSKSYSIIVALQKIIGEDDEFVGITITANDSEDFSPFFIELGTPVISLEDLGLTIDSLPEQAAAPTAIEATPSSNLNFIGRDVPTYSGKICQRLDVYRDLTGGASSPIIALELNSITGNVTGGFSNYYDTCVDYASMKLTSDSTYGRIPSFFELPSELSDSAGTKSEYSYSSLFDAFVDALLWKYNVPIVGSLPSIARDLLDGIGGSAYAEWSLTNTWKSFSIEPSFLPTDMINWAHFDNEPIIAAFTLSNTASSTNSYPFTASSDVTYRVICLSQQTHNFSYYFLDMPTAEYSFNQSIQP